MFLFLREAISQASWILEYLLKIKSNQSVCDFTRLLLTSLIPIHVFCPKKENWNVDQLHLLNGQNNYDHKPHKPHRCELTDKQYLSGQRSLTLTQTLCQHLYPDKLKKLLRTTLPDTPALDRDVPQTTGKGHMSWQNPQEGLPLLCF